MLHLREVQHDLGLGRVALQDGVIGEGQKRLPAQVGLEQLVRDLDRVERLRSTGARCGRSGNVVPKTAVISPWK